MSRVAHGNHRPDRPEAVRDEKRLTVSVIVPVYNGGATFGHCLESLSALSPPPDEIIVVDDGSTDGSSRLGQRPEFNLISTGCRRGPAAARNLGVRAASGDLLLFVDADVTLPPRAIASFLHVFEDDPEIAAIIGSYDDSPAADNLLSQYKNLLHHYFHQHAAADGFTFWGACGVIRRSVFLKMGGFDEQYRHPCIEDIELGYRLRAAGHRIQVSKQLQVKHWKKWGASSLFQTDVFRRALPWSKLILQSGRMDNDLNLTWACRMRVVFACLLPAAIATACLRPSAAIAALGIAILLLALDAPVFRYFQRKRGLWFAIRTIPWHWFSHFYSGIAFAAGLVRHLFCRRRREASSTLPAMAPLTASAAMEAN